MKTSYIPSAILSLFFVAPVTGAVAAGFPDVSSSHPKYDAELIARGGSGGGGR